MTNFPHRWFRFSLRTLLSAVTLVGVWLGYHWNWVHERRAALVCLLPAEQGRFVKGVYVAQTNPAPWPLGWFGERGHFELVAPAATSFTEIDRLERLFPEAKIVRQFDGPFDL